MNAKFMTSSRLVYRGMEPTDLDTFWRWLNDAETRRYLDHRVMPMGREAEKQLLERVSAEASSTRTQVMFAVEDAQQETLIAASGLHNIQWIPRSAEWGIIVAPEHRGAGYGKEIGARVLDFAFDDLNLERVSLRVCADHVAGLACYDGMGWVREGVLRRAFWVDGHYRDTVMMSVLADEWRAARA